MVSLLLHGALALFTVTTLYLLITVGRRGKNFPPGPPTLPLLGNLHQLPKSGAHFKFTEWAAQYGGIFSLKLGPANAIVISDRAIVKALIDKKSSIYSNRPRSYVSHDLITRGDHLLVMQHGEKWRLFRKLIHQTFQERMCEKEHIVLQDAEAVQMCRDFLMEPDQIMNHPKRFSNSIIMSILLGIRTKSARTKHMLDLYEIMEEWSKIMETGATPPVDILPILKRIPERFFNNWKSRSRAVGKAMDQLYGSQVSRVLARRQKVGSRGSFLDGILDQQDKLQLSRDELNFLCGVMMEGGSDTSSSEILAFIHAMIKYPEVQAQAHAQIDQVVDPDRSPRWSDYGQLPYVAQIVKETMRWRPVTVLAFPHATAADDTINGYTIPKNTTVILNVWGLHHPPIPSSPSSQPSSSSSSSPDPDPSIFDPTRFAHRTLSAAEYANSPNYESRDHYGYGAGRRICPGIHLAERNLWLGMAKLLWAFEFRHKQKEGGGVVEVDVDPRTGYSEGFLHCPLPFECEVRVRGEERRGTVLREFEEVTREGSGVLGRYEAP